MNRSFGNAMVLVCIFEILLSAALLMFSNPVLKIFGVTKTAYPYAISYYRIVALGCLFQGLSQLFCDFIRCVRGVSGVREQNAGPHFGNPPYSLFLLRV